MASLKQQKMAKLRVMSELKDVRERLFKELYSVVLESELGDICIGDRVVSLEDVRALMTNRIRQLEREIDRTPVRAPKAITQPLNEESTQ